MSWIVTLWDGRQFAAGDEMAYQAARAQETKTQWSNGASFIAGADIRSVDPASHPSGGGQGDLSSYRDDNYYLPAPRPKPETLKRFRDLKKEILAKHTGVYIYQLDGELMDWPALRRECASLGIDARGPYFASQLLSQKDKKLYEKVGNELVLVEWKR